MPEEFPCVHRGSEPIDIRLCDLCGVKGQPFEVYSCALFGECSVNRKHSQVRGCAACEARAETPPPLPEEIQRINANLQRAVKSGQYLIAISWIEDGQVRLERETSHAFPRADYPQLSRMIVGGLMDEAAEHFEAELQAKADARKAADLERAARAKRTKRQANKTQRANKARSRK